MTSTVMNVIKNSSTLPESMQRMITPQYEQIVNEIEHIYHHPDTGYLPFTLSKFIFEILAGLITIAQWLGLSIMAPNKKISILLIGNHSAGKSSLINWYIEDNVQRTGVAIETQGKLVCVKSYLLITASTFTGVSIITSGKRRESLMVKSKAEKYRN
jgi:hypothetical protein